MSVREYIPIFNVHSRRELANILPIMSTYMCEFVIVYICVDLYLDINN